MTKKLKINSDIERLLGDIRSRETLQVHVPKKGSSKEATAANTAELSDRKEKYVFRRKEAKVGRSSAILQNNRVYPYPTWMVKHGIKKILLEVYFETDKSHLIDPYTFRAHLLLSPRWEDPSTLRLSIKDYDFETYVALVQVLSQSVYTTTVWSRLPDNSSWYIVYGLHESVNSTRMELALASELEGLPITPYMACIRYKLKDTKDWVWPKVRDKNSDTFRIKSSTEIHRGLTRSSRMIDRAIYRMRKPPQILLGR